MFWTCLVHLGSVWSPNSHKTYCKFMNTHGGDMWPFKKTLGVFWGETAPRNETRLCTRETLWNGQSRLICPVFDVWSSNSAKNPRFKLINNLSCFINLIGLLWSFDQILGNIQFSTRNPNLRSKNANFTARRGNIRKTIVKPLFFLVCFLFEPRVTQNILPGSGFWGLGWEFHSKIWEQRFVTFFMRGLEGPRKTSKN